ncbi:unnamed protein product [Diamesa serratosioi]
MDRRNGGDPLAPPRPPKSLPRVHRPRAPEPDIVNLPINFIRMDSNLSSNSSISSSSTTATATTTHNHLQQQQPPSRQHSIPPPLPPLTPTQQQNSSNRINSNNNSNNNNNISNNNNINNNNNNNMNNNNNNNNMNNNNNNNSNIMSTTSISTFSRRRPEVVVATGTSTGQLRQLTTPLPTLQVRALTPSTLGQITSVPSTNFISTALSAARTPSPVNNSVTLQIPRPENERLPNEYVDTPFTNATTANGNVTSNNGGSGSSSSSSSNVLRGSHHSHQQQQQQLVSSQPNRTNQLNHSHTNISTIDGISVINNHNSNNNDKVILPNRTSGAVRPNLLPITKQPSFNSSTTTLCKKDQLQQQFGHDDNGVLSSANNNNGLILNSATDQLNSITCPQCNRCRCEECQRPRKLPSRWICDDNCFCSAETIIDFASCLCCVKALYYHCSKDHELDCESDSISCADNPCSCVPYKRTSRWGCLSALSLLLPCLLCYWPMRGCVSLCAKCYAKHSRHGCRCNNEQSTNNNNNFNSRLNIINLTSSNGPESPQPPTNHHHHRRSNNNDLTPEKRLLDSSNSEY